jgi:uncharacterized protein
MELSRRRFFLTLAGALITGSGAGFWLRSEAEELEVRRLRLGLTGLGEPLRLVQLSDLHASAVVRYPYLHRAVALALAERPDLVCLTGDFTTDGLSDWQPLLEVLRTLAAAVPTFAVLGNHDGRPGAPDQLHARTCDCLREAGIELLANTHLLFTRGSARLQLVGTGDLWRGPFDPARAFAGVAPALPTILLTHNPDARTAVLAERWDLALCGHTHGGQINLPGMFGRFAPVRDRHFVAGTHDLGDRSFHINRGIGSIGGLRWGARPEISVFDLAPLLGDPPRPPV